VFIAGDKSKSGHRGRRCAKSAVARFELAVYCSRGGAKLGAPLLIRRCSKQIDKWVRQSDEELVADHNAKQHGLGEARDSHLPAGYGHLAAERPKVL